MFKTFTAIKKRSLPLLIIAGALVLAVLLTALSPPPEKQQTPKPAMAISAMAVSKEDVTVSIPSQGRVRPRLSTLLTSEISGSVIEVSPDFVNGAFVKQGQLLLRFDDRNYHAAVKRAQAEVSRAKKALIEEKGRARVAHNQWKQSKQVKRSEEALSLLLRKPQLQEAIDNLAFAEAELLRVQGDLEKTQIRAPFNGLIKKKYVDYAQYATQGTQLAELVAVDYAEVRLSIPQDRLAFLDLDIISGDMTLNRGSTNNLESMAANNAGAAEETQTAEQPPPENTSGIPVVLKSFYGDKQYQWSARIVRTEGLFDEQSHTLYAVARIDDPYNLTTQQDAEVPLLLGTYVEAIIEGHKLDNLVRIPRHILRAGNHIWVIDKDDRLRNRKLDILRVGGDEVYVTNGLEEGERICLTHVGEVVPGTPVVVAELMQGHSTQTAMLDE